MREYIQSVAFAALVGLPLLMYPAGQSDGNPLQAQVPARPVSHSDALIGHISLALAAVELSFPEAVEYHLESASRKLDILSGTAYRHYAPRANKRFGHPHRHKDHRVLVMEGIQYEDDDCDYSTDCRSMQPDRIVHIQIQVEIGDVRRVIHRALEANDAGDTEVVYEILAGVFDTAVVNKRPLFDDSIHGRWYPYDGVRFLQPRPNI